MNGAGRGQGGLSSQTSPLRQRTESASQEDDGVRNGARRRSTCRIFRRGLPGL